VASAPLGLTQYSLFEVWKPLGHDEFTLGKAVARPVALHEEPEELKPFGHEEPILSMTWAALWAVAADGIVPSAKAAERMMRVLRMFVSPKGSFSKARPRLLRLLGLDTSDRELRRAS